MIDLKNNDPVQQGEQQHEQIQEGEARDALPDSDEEEVAILPKGTSKKPERYGQEEEEGARRGEKRKLSPKQRKRNQAAAKKRNKAGGRSILDRLSAYNEPGLDE